MEGCIFCKVVKGELPSKSCYQDDQVMVIADINPQAPVHWLVMPKKHIEELSAADGKLLNHMMKIIQKIIKDEKIAGYRIVNNSKEAALIDHMHFHILGRIDKFRKL